MHIICMTPLAEGVFNDHKADHITAPPEGWAYIPTEDGPIPEEWRDTVRDYSLPSTFPRLGSIEAEELTYIREVEVPMTREVPVLDEDGNPVLDDDGNPATKPEEYMDTEEREYKMLTVTNMTDGALPDPVPEDDTPTTEERIAALEEQLVESDAVAMALYEASLEQETVNAEQDAAILGLYEMIGG